MRAYLAKETEKEEKRRNVGSRVDKSLKKHTISNLCAGDVRLRNLNKMLNSLGILRSRDQIVFHEAFIQACLPHIYGKDWSEHSLRVLKDLELTRIDFEVLVMTPRRCKSFSL